MNWFVFWRKCNENNWVIQIMSEEVAGGFLLVTEYRRCKQLRRFRCVPLRKQVGIAANVVYHVYHISHSD